MKKTASILSIILALLMVLNVSAFAAGGEGGGDNPLTLVSAKVGEEDLAGSRIPAGSEITLTFSINVTDSSVLTGNIGKIKVKDADGAEATSTVSPGEEKTVFIVTLGSLAKGDYTLTIGKELTAKNGNTLGKKEEIAFSVKGDGSGSGGGNNPLSLVSVKAKDADLEGAELEASGKIVITFDRGMTDNQTANFEQISICDEAGKKVTEGIKFSDFTKNDEGNSFTELSYEGLAGGKYTLKLGKDLKANNGNTLGEDKTINFTVKAQEEEPEEKSFIDKVVDFFNSILEFLRNALNSVLSLIGITL